MRAPRLTVQRLMLLVAVVAVLLGGVLWLLERRDHFRMISIRHALQWSEEEQFKTDGTMNPASAYHRSMWTKYRRFAGRPWLPVKSDPPEPD